MAVPRIEAGSGPQPQLTAVGLGAIVSFAKRRESGEESFAARRLLIL